MNISNEKLMEVIEAAEGIREKLIAQWNIDNKSTTLADISRVNGTIIDACAILETRLSPVVSASEVLDAEDATITELRAEVDRQAKQIVALECLRDTYQLGMNRLEATVATRDIEIERLDRENVHYGQMYLESLKTTPELAESLSDDAAYRARIRLLEKEQEQSFDQVERLKHIISKQKHEIAQHQESIEASHAVIERLQATLAGG